MPYIACLSYLNWAGSCGAVTPANYIYSSHTAHNKSCFIREYK